MVKVTLERTGRDALAWVIGRLAPVKKLDPAAIHGFLRKDPGIKILFVRPHQGLGDLLLATPIFRALKTASPAIQIHFLADTYNRVAIEHNRHLDRIWVWDKKKMQNPRHLWTFLKALRAERFALAVPLSSHIPSFTSFLMARLSGAKAVLAYDTTPFYDGANWSRHLAHIELQVNPEETPEWEKFMNLVKPLMSPKTSPPRKRGSSDLNALDSRVRGNDDPPFAPEFCVDIDDEAWAREQWHKLGLTGDAKKVGLFFGGNPDRPERLWPSNSWGDLAIKIQKNPGLSLVAIVPPNDFLSGSRAREQGVYGQVAPRLSSPPALFSESRLARVAAFLRGLDLFVCVDGGLFHIAVAYRVRTLGLFFKTDPARWSPPVPWATVLRPPDDQPASLRPEEVYQKICEMVLKFNRVTDAD